MAEKITMPRLSDTMEEGTVVKWHKKVGETIKEGDIIAEIETDKAIQEFESEYDGTLLYIGVEEGQVAPIDSILAIIGDEGEDISELINNNSAAVEENNSNENSNTEAESAEDNLPASEEINTNAESPSGERIFASPLAKKIAKEKGINLAEVSGSGDNGRITKRDVENHSPAKSKRDFNITQEPSLVFDTKNILPVKKEDELVPNSSMRKVIAKRLKESKFTAPHYYLNVEVNMDKMIGIRKEINSLPDTKVSFNDMIIKACAMALRKHPQVNSSWSEENMIYHKEIHIGVAVAVEDGLLVPVVRNTDFKSFKEISAEVKDLASRARERKLKADEMEGSTFSVSNLGMFGIESFTSIINQPNSCILSVGAIIEKPIVKDGEITIGNTMKLSLACDHRTVDGATGALFLQTLTQYIESPMTMFV